jgi:hypothetical protein
LAPWSILKPDTYGFPLRGEANENIALMTLNDFNNSNKQLLMMVKKYRPEISDDYELNLNNLTTFFLH